MTAAVPPRPGQVQGNLPALVDQFVEHDWVLMRARLGVGDLPGVDHLQAAALGELAVGATIVGRVWDRVWPTVIEGLAYGVKLADLAEALATTPAAVTSNVRRWMRNERAQGRLATVGGEEIEALLRDAEAKS